MWRQVVLPVILVGMSWLTMSVATTCYVLWLDTSYQRMFDENIASANAASQLQEEVWHLHAELLSPSELNLNWSSRLAEFDRNVGTQLANLTSSATTMEERQLAAVLGDLTRQYRQKLPEPDLATGAPIDSAARQPQLFALAAQISQHADRMRQVNDELSQSSTMGRIHIRNYVLWGRTMTSIFVSALGIAFGWWTANRLKQSVTKIQVTLHDPGRGPPGELATVQVRGGDELTSIQQQVGLVVERLRRTGEELQATRQEVLRAERLAAIGGLAAGVAHELRNPLTSVKLLLQHAASHGGDAVVAEQRMGLILDEIERMEATIQGLLDFSRPARPQRQLHDLRQTLERALHLVEARAEKQHVSTALELGPQPLSVSGDPQQLHQVFVNLLINAIEAMPRGGRLSIALAPEVVAGHWVVEVQDSGDGIPSELLPRLFEPFATAKERGTGLGLAVSRRILEEHGGRIEVRSQQPRGTIFTVLLPAAKLTPAEPALVPG